MSSSAYIIRDFTIYNKGFLWTAWLFFIKLNMPRTDLHGLWYLKIGNVILKFSGFLLCVIKNSVDFYKGFSKSTAYVVPNFELKLAIQLYSSSLLSYWISQNKVKWKRRKTERESNLNRGINRTKFTTISQLHSICQLPLTWAIKKKKEKKRKEKESEGVVGKLGIVNLWILWWT